MTAILRHSAIASILVLFVLAVALVPSKAQAHSTSGTGNHLFTIARSVLGIPIPITAINVRVRASTAEQKLVGGYMNTYEHRASILIPGVNNVNFPVRLEVKWPKIKYTEPNMARCTHSVPSGEIHALPLLRISAPLGVQGQG